MKQSIQLRLGQSLTMTPQLQQAIRLLQLSTLELQVEIQQALDSNLMLEAVENESADDGQASELEESPAFPFHHALSFFSTWQSQQYGETAR